MSDPVEVTRNVTTDECHWLTRDYQKGEILYRYEGAAYGVCGDREPLTERRGETPFFEFPVDAFRDMKVFGNPDYGTGDGIHYR